MNTITYTVHQRIATITLNRPEKRNALSHELIAELKEALALAKKDQQVKVIVLKANGEAFCAGADLAYLQQLQKFSKSENLKDSNHLKELFLSIYKHPKVVVAQVQGHALAGGCGLATVCDFVFAAPHAKFGYTEVKIGFIPALVMVFLLRKIGEGRAKEMLLGGDLYTADQVFNMGLINGVVPADQLDAVVTEFTHRLVSTNSGSSMKLTKSMVDAVHFLTLEDALNYAARMNVEARSTEDCKRGIQAFLNKEKLNW